MKFMRNTTRTTWQAKGLLFEAQVVKSLRAWGCELLATQMSKDEGIDHQGTWQFPDATVQVVTQCKNETKPVGVAHLRAFDGVLNAFSSETLGIFASRTGFSAYAHRYLLHMTHPTALCTMDNGEMRGFLMNESARALLPKLTIATAYDQDGRESIVLAYGTTILGDA